MPGVNDSIEKKQGVSTFKMIIVGEGDSGKTTFVTRFIPSSSVQLEDSTISCIPFETSLGSVEFHVKDTNGQELYQGTDSVKDEFFIGAQCRSNL